MKENPEKTGAEIINPYDNVRGKGDQVREMFDSIAPAYDFMNKAMTFGLHRYWRDKALHNTLKTYSAKTGKTPLSVLDVATGTGDVAFRIHEVIPGARITGIDLSPGMLDVARRKLLGLPENERGLIAFGKADCLRLPFHDGDFNMITVAYGVRNFENLMKGFSEMHRVLGKGGVLCVIELSVPSNPVVKLGYKAYTGVIPVVGKTVSGDSRAYSYLPESIAACPQRDDMAAIMLKAGFSDVRWKSLTMGVVTYYIAIK